MLIGYQKERRWGIAVAFWGGRGGLMVRQTQLAGTREGFRAVRHGVGGSWQQLHPVMLSCIKVQHKMR